MTIKDDMKARLASTLSAMIADGGGNSVRAYLTHTQVQTISSKIVENFFILDRDELMKPQIASETGRAHRYLHSLNHNLFPNVTGDDDWSLAVEKLASAIHDIEALELCLAWKEKKDAEEKELETLAYNLYNLSHPQGHWAALDPSIKKDWLDIARNAKRLLA